MAAGTVVPDVTLEGGALLHGHTTQVLHITTDAIRQFTA